MGQLWLTPQGEISRSLGLNMTVGNGSGMQGPAPPVLQSLKSVFAG